MDGVNDISVKDGNVLSMLNHYNNTVIALAQERYLNLLDNIRNYNTNDDYNMKNISDDDIISKGYTSISRWYLNYETAKSVILSDITSQIITKNMLNNGVLLNLNTSTSICNYFSKTLNLGERLTLSAVYQIYYQYSELTTNQGKDVSLNLEVWNGNTWEIASNYFDVSDTYNNILNSNSITLSKHIFYDAKATKTYDFRLAVSGSSNDNAYSIKVINLNCVKGTIAANSLVDNKPLLTYKDGELQVLSPDGYHGLIESSVILVGQNSNAKYQTITDAIIEGSHKNFFLVGNTTESQSVTLPENSRIIGNNFEISLGMSYKISVQSNSIIQDVRLSGGSDTLTLTGSNVKISNISILKCNTASSNAIKIINLTDSILEGISVYNPTYTIRNSVYIESISNSKLLFNKLETGYKNNATTNGTGLFAASIIGCNIWIGDIKWSTGNLNYSILPYDVNGNNYTVEIENYTSYEGDDGGEITQEL